jgi:flagellar basal-body rod modification protein FlgD
MAISTVTSIPPTANQSSESTTSAASASVDYNAFLRLLIAQIKNQDPTKPMDSAQLMSQLASFSNVEQSIKINQKLDSLMTSTALSQIESLVGRTLISTDGTVSGTVMAVRVISGGTVAILENGTEVPLGPGVIIG